MVSVMRPGDTPRDTAGALSSVSLSDSCSQDSSCSVPLGDYRFTRQEQSECTLVLFACHTETSARFVIKLLCEYQDTRYHFKTCVERQCSQLEALRQNRVFAPGVSLGLARVQDLDPENLSLSIDEFMPNPTPERLSQAGEYALIMRQLPDERRLDCLLQEQNGSALQEYIQRLASHVSYLHAHRAQPLMDEEKERWGNADQLEKKLLHNFALLDLVLAKDPYRSGQAYRRLARRFNALKEALYDAFISYRSDGYFAQRVTGPYIKHCHGDLKSPNIWIMAGDQARQKTGQVFVLDTADFNSLYTRIDILSDIALLAVDIQARTHSSLLADLLLNTYLQQMEQRDSASAAVLAYYLVEKALVGVAVSLAFDDLPELGLAFLETAEMRARMLRKKWGISEFAGFFS